MFDVGFLELLIVGVISLLILGPERLPGAARTAGRWVGQSRRLVRQFTTELDRQLKADELREKLRKEGDVGLEDLKKNVNDGMREARKYEHMIVSGNKTLRPRPGYPDSENSSDSRTDRSSQNNEAASGENPETEPPTGQKTGSASGTTDDSATGAAKDTAAAADPHSDSRS